MDVKITKWGNSLGIRLPKNLLDELSIKEGDSLVVESNNQTMDFLILCRKNIKNHIYKKYI